MSAPGFWHRPVPPHLAGGIGLALILHLSALQWLLSLRNSAVPEQRQVQTISASVVSEPAAVTTPQPPEPTPDMAAPAPTPPPVAKRESPIKRPATKTPAPRQPAPPVTAPAATPAATQAAPVKPEVPPPVEPPRFDADYLANPAPAYPPISRRQGDQGTVLLDVAVSADGRADEVGIARSSGHPRLDEAARKAVLRWKFKPAQRGGIAIAARVKVPVQFSLTPPST